MGPVTRRARVAATAESIVIRRMLDAEARSPLPGGWGDVSLCEKTRAIIVSWIIEVHNAFKLVEETLYIAVDVLDRFLAKHNVLRDRLQLAGATALFIAAKYEEVCAPKLLHFMHVSSMTYPRDAFLAMEMGMLNALHFDVVVAPSARAFMSYFLDMTGWHVGETTTLCSYIVALTLLEHRVCNAYAPSAIAASAVYIALQMLERDDVVWTLALHAYTSHTRATLRPCMHAMRAIAQGASANTLTAVLRRTYAGAVVIAS